MLPPRPDHARAAVRFALDMHAAAASTRLSLDGGGGGGGGGNGSGVVHLRVGLACGPVTAGVVGHLRARFCVFGDTGAWIGWGGRACELAY